VADKLRQMDAQRQLLHAKRNEILRLKQDYQYGILELEDEAQRLMKQARIHASPQGLKNREIELVLQNIQRRLAYSAALEKPLHWIDDAAEELLFLQRRASIDLHVKDIAGRMDFEKQVNEMDHALDRSRLTPDRLSADPRSSAPPSVEAIGKRLLEQTKSAATAPDDRQNQEIMAEVCSGNLMRAAELSTLSPKAARCLAESDAKHLFLNRLAELSSPAARKLSEWGGHWLCLNGFERLSPDVASHLFTWRGQWLSLNGLSELSAEAGMHIVPWNGQQLELMGLRKPTGVEYLEQWEAAGGRLFVPDAIRREIDRRRAGQSGRS
jgi:hypothetical protein